MTIRSNRSMSRRAHRLPAARSLLGLGAAAAASAAAALAGCASDGASTGTNPTTTSVDAANAGAPAATTSDDAPPTPDDAATTAASETPPPTLEDLRTAADRWWTAFENDDWATMYELEDPRVLREATVDEYSDWQSKNQPFRVIEADLRAAEIEDVDLGRIGWVEVSQALQVRRFEDAPVVENAAWDVWQVLDGEWRPVPDSQLQYYPLPPSRRLVETEDDLRRRFERSWDARRDQNWPLLWTLVSPEDQEQIEFEQFVGGFEQIIFNDVEIWWVQATPDGKGVVQGVMELKKNDPSQTKAPFEPAVVGERWVMVGGTWYLDLPDPPPPPPAQASPSPGGTEAGE